jgi:4-alpha-glucanotransferase
MLQPQMHHTIISTVLSPLRSDGCWGAGDLGCLKPLTDIAVALGIGHVDVCGIRDYAAKESSIYPAFIDLRPLGTIPNRGKDAEYRARAAELDALPEADLPKVYNTKLHFLNDKFAADGAQTLSSDSYHAFWRSNRDWLESYTVFCTLRHKYGTGNNRYWAEPEYQKLLIDDNFIKEYSVDLRFHLYVQYLLHMQWDDAVSYAASRGVELTAGGEDGAVSLHQDGENLETWELEGLIRQKLCEGTGELSLPLRDWLGITTLGRKAFGEGEMKSSARMEMTLEDILAHRALLEQIRKAIETPDK